MAHLDPFLSALVTHRAGALLLDADQPVRLTVGDTVRPISRQPLSGAQVNAILREIAPADALRSLDCGGDTVFGYTSAHGSFEVSFAQQQGNPAARILQLAGDGASPPVSGSGSGSGTVNGNGHGAAPAGTPASPTHAAPVVQVREAQRDPTSRAEMEGLLRKLVEHGGSDLHLRVGEPPIVRADGGMRRLEGAPLDDARLSRLLLSIMPSQNEEEYLGTNDTDFAHEIAGVARFRCNALRERRGSAGVFRIVPTTIASVDDLGLSAEVQRLCALTKGLVLVTGPTGSGKSTTLCALIDLVNRTRDDHVITIEDPIEFVHENKRCVITQRQVGSHTGSFRNALRAALREDPDIILVGELRDLETVSIAIETAETGHLVFGTLHTTTAASTIDRLVDQFPADRQDQIRVMLSESLKGVISQTLCKKIGGGRVAAREILLTIPAVSNLIREGKTFQIPSIIQTQKRLGMVTLSDALIELVDANLIEPREAHAKANDKQGFAATLKQRGHDIFFLDPADVPARPEPPRPAGKK
jgi:twitching motility protein PilT